MTVLKSRAPPSVRWMLTRICEFGSPGRELHPHADGVARAVAQLAGGVDGGAVEGGLAAGRQQAVGSRVRVSSCDRDRLAADARDPALRRAGLEVGVDA